MDSFDFESFVKTQINIPIQQQLKELHANVNKPLSNTYEKDLMRNYLSYNKLTQQHIDVYNQFIKKSANIICSKVIKMDDGRTIHFENLKFEKPYYQVKNVKRKLYPMYARRHYMTYDSEWTVDIVIKKDNQLIYPNNNRITIAKIPVMLFSNLCHLEYKTSFELVALGEDPIEQGGYFIIVGVEKILMLEEKLSTNRIFIMNSSPKIKKYKTAMRLTSNTSKGTFLNEIIFNINNVMKYSFQSLRKKNPIPKKVQFENTKKINIIYLFQLFSLTFLNKQYCYKAEDIINLIMPFLKDRKNINNLYVSIAGTSAINVNQKKPIGAKEVILKKMNVGNISDKEKMDEIKKMLLNAPTNGVFDHLEEIDRHENETDTAFEIRIVKSKVNLLVIMVAQYLDFLNGFSSMDDRDDWANKRLEGPGRKMEQLIRISWNKVLKEITDNVLRDRMANSEIVKNFHSGTVSDTITKIFRDSFINSKWGIKGSNQKNNATQTLVRDNMLASLSHINTINVNIQRTDKNVDIRMVQLSQYRYVAYVETPDGSNAGLVKNLAITTRLSLDRGIEGDRIIIILIAYTEEQTLDHQHVLMLNSKYLGWCNGPATRALLIEARRRGDIYYDTSLFIDDQFLWIDASPSRLLAPVLIVDEESQKLILDIKEITDLRPENLIKEGAMEYISAWEEQNLKIAMDIEHLYNRKEKQDQLIKNLNKARLNLQSYVDNHGDEMTAEYDLLIDTVALLQLQKNKFESNKPFTHCELSGRAALGVASDMIPFMQHNQAPRNIYQCLWEEEPVLMADGSRKMIKDVQIGDQVVTFDPDTLLTSITSVINQYVRPTDKIIYRLITKCNKKIIATEDHKFMTNEGWCEMQYLKNKLVAVIGFKSIIFVPIESIEIIENCMIADITTESENHSFIGGDGFCVHNSQMGKQAVGNYHLNYKCRFDGTVKVLESTHPPVVKTDMYDTLGLSERGMGQNVIVAFASLPDNEEDSFIFNGGSIDRGLFRMVKYFNVQGKVKISDPNIKSYFKKPTKLKPGEDPSIYENLNEHGIPIIGSCIKEHQCVIGIVKEKKGIQYNASIYLNEGETGIVDDVLFHETSTYEIINVKLRITRTPKVGWKFAARQAQKGTIGTIKKEEDMMFEESTGIKPDIIVNTTVIPSRMTISYLMELSAGKAAAMYGETVDASAFQHLDMDKYKEMLRYVGYNTEGYSKMRDGETGEVIETEIYTGVVYFTALKHQPEDKINVRSLGPINAVTHQSVKGRQWGGGLRFGTMEVDALNAHGASATVKERLCDVSDKYKIPVCKPCGTTAVYNDIEKKFYCPSCDSSNVGALTIPYVNKYQNHLLTPYSIKMGYVVGGKKDYIYEEELSEDNESESEQEESSEDDVNQASGEESESEEIGSDVENVEFSEDF